MKNGITRKSCLVVLAAVSLATLQLGIGWPQPAEARAPDRNARVVSYAASIVFGIAPGQTARFCVGTSNSRGPALDWTGKISDEQGNLLFQMPEIRSPAGEWRCSDVARGSLAVSGESTGRVQVLAGLALKAPRGTQTSDFISSFEIVNGDGTSAGAPAGILWATFNDH